MRVRTGTSVIFRQPCEKFDQRETHSWLTQSNKLAILWTSSDKEVAQKMVFMYAKNSRLRDWWGQVRVIIWGPSAKMVATDGEIQEELQELKQAGVELQACKACADQYGVSEQID